MYAIFDTDTSFFILGKDGVNITSDVIEISITEQVGKLLSGNLLLNDPIWYYAKIFPAGKTFDLSWGYKQKNETLNEILVKVKNPQEVLGLQVRSGIKGIVTMPKYTFNANGQKVFSCGFYGSEYGENFRETKIYNYGTKKQMIEEEMQSLGVTKYNIKFESQNDSLQTKSVMKNEKAFRFLLRIAKEWRCYFFLNRTVKGELQGTFIQNTDIGSKAINEFISSSIGAIGSSKLFEFGIGATYPNVINGDITYNVGESGQGDHVTFDIVGKKVVVTRYVTEEGKTIAYKLNESKIRKFAEERQGDFNQIMSNVLLATDMDSVIWNQTKVKDFFTPEIIETAPQGVGYSGNLNLIGDPTLTIPMEAKFGEGFPEQLKNPDPINRIFIESVEHNLSQKGYMAKVGVSDAITLYGAYVEGEG